MEYSINRKPLLEEDENDSGDDSPLSSSRETAAGAGGDEGANYGFPHGTEPRDWYRGGFMTFYLLGIITMLPYTFFVTANDYWMYKLRDINGTVNGNKTTLQAEFTSYLTIAASGPSVFFMIINSLFSHRISIQIRVFGSLTIIFLSFIVTTVLVEIDTDSWQDAFFAVTLCTVVLVNVFGAILTAGLYGIAVRFPARYISAVVSGQALGGLFPAIVYIASLAVGASSTHCALLYFCIANVTILLSLGCYYILSRSLFFQFHMLVKAPVNTLNYDPLEDGDTEPDAAPRLQISVLQVFVKTWEYGVSSMLCYMVSLSIYPAVSVLISSVDEKSIVGEKYFVPAIAFLTFSFYDYIGRITAGWWKWPLQRKWVTMGLTLMRIAFIPLFLLCNAHPRHNLPVLVNSDSVYIAATCLFGFTNGYITNIILINVPKIVEPGEQEAASSIITTFISIGCALGAMLSFVFLRIL